MSRDNKEHISSLSVINVLTKVLFVLAIISIVAFSALGISSFVSFVLLLVRKDEIVGPNGYPLWYQILHETFDNFRGHPVSIYSFALSNFCSFIYSIGMILVSIFALRYFKRNIKDKTPFTKRSGNEILYLGLANIITGGASMIICGISYGVFYHLFNNDVRNYFYGENVGVVYAGRGWTGLGIGIIFIIVSFAIKAANESINNAKK